MSKLKDIINEPYDRVCIFSKNKGIVEDRNHTTESELQEYLECRADIEVYEDFCGLDEEDNPILIPIRLLNIYTED